MRPRSLSRGRFASPGPRRAASPLGVSVVQRSAQLAERTAESAISGVGQIADAVRIARAEAAMAAANVQSAIGTVQTLATSLSAHMDVATAKAMSEMEARMQQVASYLDAQNVSGYCHVTAAARIRKSEMVSVAASVDEMAVRRTRDVEERIRREVEAKLQQEQATTYVNKLMRHARLLGTLQQSLIKLTKQLNDYKPTQEATVIAQGERLCCRC